MLIAFPKLRTHCSHAWSLRERETAVRLLDVGHLSWTQQYLAVGELSPYKIRPRKRIGLRRTVSVPKNRAQWLEPKVLQKYLMVMTQTHTPQFAPQAVVLRPCVVRQALPVAFQITPAQMTKCQKPTVQNSGAILKLRIAFSPTGAKRCLRA